MFNFLTGGLVKAVESVAKEWIDTPKETAEANALMIKTLDPNGLMRRQISLTVSILYSMYVIIALVLLLLQAFDITPIIMRDGVEYRAVDNAIESIKELFTPITTLFGVIVSASFGVNSLNTVKNK